MPPKRQASTRGGRKKRPSTGDAAAESKTVTSNHGHSTTVDDRSLETLTAEAVPESPSNTLASSTPSASSIGRLGSLNSPATSSAAPRGKKLLSQPKFSGRRSQAKRDELQRAEDDRKQAETQTKANEEAEKRRREARRRDQAHNRGRGRGQPWRGRARGGYMGDNRNDLRDVVASGPFSAGKVNEDILRAKARHSRPGVTSYPRPTGTTSARQKENTETRQRGGRTASSTVAAEDGSIVKQEFGPGSTALDNVDGDGDVSMDVPQPVLVDDGSYISSDEDEDNKGIRNINVEDLSIIDLTQDDSEYDAFAPIRVHRTTHRERPSGINVGTAIKLEDDGEIEASDLATVPVSERRRGKQKLSNFETVSETKRFQPVYSDSDDEGGPTASIKPDPDGDLPAAQTPEPVPAGPNDLLPQEPPSSPETKKKTKEKIKSKALAAEPILERSDGQTQEEFEELQRQQKESGILRSELGTSYHPAHDKEEGGIIMMDSQTVDPRADKIYLFQFPPVLPDLLPIDIKPDPENITVATNNAEAMEIDPPTTTKQTITVQDDRKPALHQPKLPSGAIGKLKVHASGRVTIDWGGMPLSLGMGTEASFLQDVIMAKLPDAKTTEDGEPPPEPEAGTATNFGQVKGKFVITPDWDELLA